MLKGRVWKGEGEDCYPLLGTSGGGGALKRGEIRN